jgi:hypothetical protein
MQPIAALYDVLSRMRDSWPGGGWSWDGRLSCIASTFNVDVIPEARQAAALALPVEWNESNLRKAPALVHEIADVSGGVRSDQLVLTASPVSGVLAYGLWWPWGNGINLSLRVGLAGTASDRDQQRLRELFRVKE